MAFKFIAFATLVAAANAGVLSAVAPLAYAPVEHLTYTAPVLKKVEYDAHPQYNFGYDVHDTLTGDAKRQHETRNGDVVKGSYSLIEADGTRRTVDYTADDIHGFNAVVHKEPATLAVKTVAAAPVAVKTIAAAPVAVKTVAALPVHAPVHAPAYSYAAPVAHASYSYAAPVAHSSAYSYSAPVAHASTLAYAAPIAKYAVAPLANHYAYAAPATTYVH